MSLKPQPAQKVIKALSKLGFKIVRKHGSHVVLKHPDGRLTVVPVHPGEENRTWTAKQNNQRHGIIQRGIFSRTLKNSLLKFGSRAQSLPDAYKSSMG
jgi:predicted RNA binding protein YcfA (HicA-like mRNA interferase family)